MLADAWPIPRSRTGLPGCRSGRWPGGGAETMVRRHGHCRTSRLRLPNRPDRRRRRPSVRRRAGATCCSRRSSLRAWASSTVRSCRWRCRRFAPISVRRWSTRNGSATATCCFSPRWCCSAAPPATCSACATSLRRASPCSWRCRSPARCRPTPQMLIVMRAAQGIGAALMVPGSLAIIAKSYPAATRGRAIGTWAAFSSLTTSMGPFIGGMVLSFGADWMWRLIFAINVPIGLVALGLLYWRVPRDRPTQRRRLDIPGAVLATAGLGADGVGAHQLRPAGERAPRFAFRCGWRRDLRCSAASSCGSGGRGRRWSSSSCSARAPSRAPMSSR